MIIPQLPSSSYKTYEIISPLTTHWRKATCEEAGCGAYERGWKTIVPIDSPQAQYIRSGASGRRYDEMTSIDSAMTEFMFPPGQTCFASDKHRVPLERDPLFVVRGGDARGNPLGERRVVGASEWVDDFATHQERIKKAREG